MKYFVQFIGGAGRARTDDDRIMSPSTRYKSTPNTSKSMRKILVF